jgi:arabinogalactan endo-1,4-beta-galactosidase
MTPSLLPDRIKTISVIVLLVFSCFVHETARPQFVRGADIGWLSQMEATGYKFYDSTGMQKNCLQILKDKDINTVRLRVWVNPSNDRTNGHCSKNEVVTMALRAKAMGMKVMIDFHYSDSWADPGKQNKPAAWAGHTFSQLLTDVYSHTFEVLDTLKKSGVVPAWAQVGNEITRGMLWPDGSTGNWPQLGQLLNKGYDAVKAVDSSIQVVIHLDQGNNNALFRTFFDNAKNQGVRYDIIGLSYYPYWLGTDYTATIGDLGQNMNDLVARYGKDVMVVEVGGDYTKVQNTYDMLLAVIDAVQTHAGNHGLGVIYWEPEGAKSWSGYQLSCWGDDGRPTAALDAFLDPGAGIGQPGSPAGFDLYPNPNHDGLLNIRYNSRDACREIRIFDINDRMVLQKDLPFAENNSVQLHLPPGLYMVMMQAGTSARVRKLIIK